MKGKATLFCIATAMLVAGAATAAPTLSAKEAQARNTKLAQLKANHANHKQPDTIAQAARTERTLANGATVIEVPTSMWVEARAERDANGNVRVTEGSADGSKSAFEEQVNE